MTEICQFFLYLNALLTSTMLDNNPNQLFQTDLLIKHFYINAFYTRQTIPMGYCRHAVHLFFNQSVLIGAISLPYRMVMPLLLLFIKCALCG